jgi:hypothetical protein
MEPGRNPTPCGQGETYLLSVVTAVAGPQTDETGLHAIFPSYGMGNPILSPG